MEEREVQLIDYLRVVWRQKWVILVTFLAAIVAAWGGSQVVVPVYKTETSLLLLPPLSSELGAEPAGSRLAPEAYAELAVSTSLLQMMIERLDLPASVTIKDLKDRFSVSVKRLSSGSELLLTASIRGSDPAQLPDMANTWTELFTETYGELFQDRVARSYTYVNDNYEETEAELEALIEQRTAFLDNHPLVVQRAEATALQAMLESNLHRLLNTQQEWKTAEAYLSAQQDDRDTDSPSFTVMSDLDPYTLLGALAFGIPAEEYARIAAIRMEDLEQNTAKISVDLAALQQEIDVAAATLSELDHKINLLRQARGVLSTRLQEAKLALAETPEPIRVIDEPLAPRSQITPKNTTNIAVAGFLGLMVGMLLAFFLDYLERVREQERMATELAKTQPARPLQDAPSNPQAQPHREDEGS